MSIVKFPDDPSTPKAGDARELCERRHAHAKKFLELDPLIFRAAMLAEIVAELMFDDNNPDGSLREQTAWATLELCARVRELREVVNDDAEQPS